MAMLIITIFKFGALIFYFIIIFNLFYANWFCKVREGRPNENVVDGKTLGGIPEVMLIVQVIFFHFFGKCADYLKGDGFLVHYPYLKVQ